MLHFRRSVLFTTSLVLILGAALSGEAREAWLSVAAPSLASEMRHHVTCDSDSRFLEYCRDVGMGRMTESINAISRDLTISSWPLFLERRPPCQAAEERLALACAAIFHESGSWRRIHRARVIGAAHEFERRQWEKKYIELASRLDLSPLERLRQVDEITRVLLADGDTDRPIYTSALAAHLSHE